MKKRIISLFAVALIAWASTANAYATSRVAVLEPQERTVVITNEYIAISELAKQNVDSLRLMGYDEREINDIQNYKEVFVNQINELSEFDKETLKEFGYSDTQINTIMNFDGTEAEIMRASATVTLTVSANLTYDGDYTTGHFNYSWKWNGMPAFKMQDMVAVSWNSWPVTKEGATISYYNMNTAKYYTAKAGTYTNDGQGTEGAAHKFNMILNNENYAKQGTGMFNVKSDVHAKKDMHYYIAYGHSEFGMNISFSISSGGLEPSLEFSKHVVTLAPKKGTIIPK